MNKALAAIAAFIALEGCALFRPTVGMGNPVPAWALSVTDGGDTVRSSKLAGRPGMLVWIDPLCPQVENVSQYGGALRTLESRWNATDSAWVYYVAARSYKDAVLKPNMWRPWLKEMKLRGSVLLDTSMALAHRLGIRRVPTAVVVDAKGILRWKGPVQTLEPPRVESTNDSPVAKVDTDTTRVDSLQADSLGATPLPPPPPLPPARLAPIASQVLDSVLAGRPWSVPSARDSGCPVQETLW